MIKEATCPNIHHAIIWEADLDGRSFWHDYFERMWIIERNCTLKTDPDSGNDDIVTKGEIYSLQDGHFSLSSPHVEVCIRWSAPNASATLPAIFAPLLGGALINIAGGNHSLDLGYRLIFACATFFLIVAAIGILFVRERSQSPDNSVDGWPVCVDCGLCVLSGTRSKSFAHMLSVLSRQARISRKDWL
jgi:hypothetical protein